MPVSNRIEAGIIQRNIESADLPVQHGYTLFTREGFNANETLADCGGFSNAAPVRARAPDENSAPGGQIAERARDRYSQCLCSFHRVVVTCLSLSHSEFFGLAAPGWSSLPRIL